MCVVVISEKLSSAVLFVISRVTDQLEYGVTGTRISIQSKFS
jgi:hypothetical protein